MAMSYSSYKQGYRGVGKSTTTTNVQPEMEIVLNKREVIYTNENGKLLVTRIQTNNSTYWMYNNEIVEAVYGLEETYKIVNRDSKINTILGDELG